MFENKRVNRMRTTGKAMGMRALAAVLFAVALSSIQSAEASSPWIAQPTWSVPDNGTVAVGDLDGDGKPDMLFGHWNSSGTLTAYRNTGTATAPAWTAAPASWTTVSLCDSAGYYMPALVDLNGDGLLDLVIGTRNYVCIYQNTGTAAAPTWTRNTAWETNLATLTTNRFYSPALADLDGDGKPDLLVVNSGNVITAFKNSGTTAVPAWTSQPSWVPQYKPGGTYAKIALGDLDGDGKIDLAYAAGLDGYVYLYQNTGSTSAPQWVGYAANWSLIVPTSVLIGGYGVAIADFNGDGKPDLVRSSSSSADIFQQSPSGMGSPGAVLGLPAATGVVSETFDSFSCPGSWQPDPNGPNSSYSRDCGNGWKAYAEDMSNTVLTPGPPYTGPVGDQNIVTLDNTVNGPSAAAATPLGSILMNTAPGAAPRGALWLLKTFPVQPRTQVQILKADLRGLSTGVSQNFSLMVFDGAVTSPYGKTSGTGVPQRSDLLGYQIFTTNTGSGTCVGITTGNWCPWQTADIGGQQYIFPTTSYITVAFRMDDTYTTYQPFAEFDNLVVSNVTTSSSSPVADKDLAQLWSATYQAGGADNGASAADIVTDGAGNSYVTGTFNNGLNFDIVTIKYNDTGTPVAPWPLTYDGGNDDQAVAMALDPLGNINVIGRRYNGSDNDYVVLKYSSGGSLIWSSVYDNGGRDDVPTSLAVDGGGNIYVTGSSCGTTGGCDYATVKFNAADGSIAWQKFYDGGGDDQAVGVKLDGSGNVYVTGTSAGASDDVVTIKYDNSGNQLWQSRYDSGANERATALAVDSAGDSYVTGFSYSNGGSTPAILVLKYGPGGGAPLWIKTYVGSGGQALPTAMTLDAAGNVYITGKSGQVANYDMLTLKYLSSGTLAWAQTYGNAGLNDWGTDLAVDGNGYVYVLGAMSQATGNSDYVTVKYDPTGVALSAITYDGSSTSDTPAAIALGVDGQGDTTAYITGTSLDNTSGLDVINTLRYEKAQPDLTMTQLTPPALAPIGGDISVANTVLNVSDVANKIYVPSGPFTISFYLAPDSNHSALTLLGTRDISDLAPGQSNLDNTTLTIPSFTTPGNYVLVAVADSGGVVTEANESNNLLTSAAFSVGAPDFQVNSVSTVSTSMTRGNSYTVTTSVQNIGGYDSPAGTSFRVGIYLSTDNTITTGDILIGTRTITSLAASAIDTADTTVTIPTGMAAGTYYLGAIVDDQNAVVETNETNNTGVYYLSGNTVLLDTDTDFNPGLSVSGTTGIVVNGTGTAATLILDKDTSPGAVAWQAPLPAWPTPPAITGITLTDYGFGDLNGDGTQDMVAGETASYSSKVYGYSNSSSTTPTWTRSSIWDLASPCGSDVYANPILVDLDGDGLLDMVIGTRYHVCIYKNTGTSAAPTWTRADGTGAAGHTASGQNWESGLPSSSGLSYGYFSPAAADLDGDGYVDLMIGSYYNATVTGYKFSGINSSTGACNTATCWTAQAGWTMTITSANHYENPALADLDLDGKIDMLVGSSIGVVKAFQNTCTTCSSGPTWSTGPSSWVPASSSLGNIIAYPRLKDLTGDGRVDLVVGGSTGVYKPFLIVPPYLSSGIYYSAVQDAGNHSGYTTLSYTSTIPTNTTLGVDVRAGNTATPDGTWTAWLTGIVNGGDISALGTNRYVQFRVNLGTTAAANGLVSADLDSIQAYTNPATGPSQVVAITIGGGSSGGGELSTMDLLILGLFVLYARSRTLRRSVSGFRL